MRQHKRKHFAFAGSGEDGEVTSGEISRPPTVEDLLQLCRELNQRGARYLVVGDLPSAARAI